MPNPETERLQRQLADEGYIAGGEICLSLHLARELGKPLLVEGPAGVGKTEIAKVLARLLGTDLIRLQCYEGLDTSTALYEWNYQRQLLQIRMEEQGDRSLEQREAHIFSEPFLLKRPLLQAITHHRPPVLLIDELDRADEEFESFLLELLSDWQITIPELGTIRASHVPHVVVTGNRTRELSDALRRRCFYLWIDYPDFDKELAIVGARVDGIDAELAAQICRFMAGARRQQLEKPPGVAETLDWARALVALHRRHLDAATVEETLGLVFKDYHDVTHVKQSLAEFLESVGVRPAPAPGAAASDAAGT
ncbi:MAG: MoxR family ATPase [Gemmatimonadaceae bacterium]|nr:MoxR family ATPase [Gemmatimonadaceae bacterium]